MIDINKKHLKDFLIFLEIERNYSPETIRAYRSDLLQFFEHISPKIAIKNVKIDEIQNFIQILSRKNLSSRSLSRKIASLKSFYNYLFTFKLVDVNISSSLKSPKLSKSLPNFLSKDEISKLLDYPIGSTFKELRDKLILELFYATGIRISELVKIEINHINLDSRTIKIKGKGNKERLVIFGKTVLSILNNYLVERNQQKQNQSSYLFTKLKNINKSFDGHIHTRTVYGIVKKYIKKISGNEELSPHSLRHSFATHLLDNGADLVSVKDLLGHSSLSSTQVYTHIQIKKLKNIFSKSHPHAK